MSFDFLTVGAEGPEAQTPITHIAAARGARLGVSRGFKIANAFQAVGVEAQAAAESVVYSDTSHSQKIELQGPEASLDAVRKQLGGVGSSTLNRLDGGGWWCRWHPERAMLVADPVGPRPWPEPLGSRISAIDVTSVWCSLTVVGPSARELIARCCSLDLRPSSSQSGDFHPASIARTPGAILNEGSENFRLFVGWAVGEYVWEVLADAAIPLRGQPAGLECLASLAASGRAGVSHA